MYVTSTRNIISSYDVVLDEFFSSTLSYMSQYYAGELDILPAVSNTPYVKSSREKTGNIITSAQSEEENVLSETCDNTESCNEFYENYTIPPLISEEYMDVMDSGDESADEPIVTEMLEDICDGIKSHPGVNRREALYKRRDCIRQRQSEQKGALKATPNMGKGLHKVFKTVLIVISQDLPPLGESGL